MQAHTIFRVYGFTHKPYILPAFLTTRSFALQLVIKNLVVENEHFISCRKASNIKFPWVIRPFIIKTNDAFSMIESLLKDMGFKMATAINYDPHNIISIKKQVNKKKTFEHQEVEGLDEKENWLDHPSPMQKDDMQNILHHQHKILVSHTKIHWKSFKSYYPYFQSFRKE